MYANSEVRLGSVDVLGFDYDFTLVSYKHTVQQLIYDIAKQYLVENLRYPPALETTTFDPTFCIRGLVFDRKNGNLLK